MTKILIVEDDRELNDALIDTLTLVGYQTFNVDNGKAAISFLESNQIDLIISDIQMDDMDGLKLLDHVQNKFPEIPVLLMTAYGTVQQAVNAIQRGALDYLVKPFAFSELMARMEALVRRVEVDAPATKLQVGDLELDLLSREVTRGGKVLDLQPREFRLLEYLMKHHGQVVTRTMLLEKVWDYHFDPQTNIIDVHISRLRGKIDKGFDKTLLHTVRGAGYVLRD